MPTCAEPLVLAEASAVAAAGAGSGGGAGAGAAGAASAVWANALLVKSTPARPARQPTILSLVIRSSKKGSSGQRSEQADNLPSEPIPNYAGGSFLRLLIAMQVRANAPR